MPQSRAMFTDQPKAKNRHWPSLARWLAASLSLWWTTFPSHAHIGSPNVFFGGKAGPYSVHVVVRPPSVIPGLAQISVRVDDVDVSKVRALPIRWNTGRQGAPRADDAILVRGETNL